jgi:hypothetical protein
VNPSRPTSKEEVAAVLRHAESLGDCGPEPEDIDAAADRVAHRLNGERALGLLQGLRDGTCGDREAATAEVLAWIREEQARTWKAMVAESGLPVMSARDLAAHHHIIVESDGVTMDPSRSGGDR